MTRQPQADGRRALATAARGEVARRAARLGNIDELASRRHFDVKMSSDAAPARGRRHFAPSSTGRPPSGILPDTTDSYDAPKFASRRPRHYFDETVRASRYAELLGRAEDRLELGGLAEGPLEVADGEALPLCVRRVLGALTPAAHDKDLTPAAQEWCRREVEAGLHRLLASRRRTQTPCQRPSATQDPQARWPPGAVAAPRATGRAAVEHFFIGEAGEEEEAMARLRAEEEHEVEAFLKAVHGQAPVDSVEQVLQEHAEGSTAEASEALDRVPEDDGAGEDSPGTGSHGPLQDSPGAENHGPPQDDVQVAPRVGPLPTLLTSGRSWEKLILAVGEMGKADKVAG